MSIQPAPIIEEVSVRNEPWSRWFQNIFNKLQNIDTEANSTFSGNINVTGVYQQNGTSGQSVTLTFGGGASGEVLTQTFSGGILTAHTLVP